MLAFRRRLIAHLAIAASLLGSAAQLNAQASRSATEYPDSRVDIYGGYGYFHPINSGVGLKQYFDVTNPNATVGVTGWFNHYMGVEMEAGYFSGTNEHQIYDPHCSKEECSQLIYTAEAGPIVRVPFGPWIPYVHALGGGVRNNGPVTQPLTWGWGVTGGAGLDYTVPFFHKHVAARLFQADWQYSQVVYGPLVLPEAVKGGFGEIDALKLSGGLVIKLGEVTPGKKLDVGCLANPATAYPGDIVKVTASSVNFDPKRPAGYTWKTNGGKLTPAQAEATIDTTGLAPGEYIVSAKVVQGMKARQQASCTTPFVVKPFEPPTLTCSANPSTAAAGTTIDISTSGTSPQNRPLTYSYTASAGEITSDGPTAKLATAGLGATTVIVTCNVVDDLGHTAQSNTQVTLTTPPTPTVAETQDLCHIGFERDRRRPVRVDNEAKGCLDDVALTLQQQSSAKLVMVGNSAANEHPEAGAERALNAQQYLVQEKGIESSRIELRIGSMPGRFVSNTLVPPGAHFDAGSTRIFDENSIVRHGQAYGTHHAGVTLAPHYTPRHKSGAVRRALPARPVQQDSSPAPATPAKPGASHAKPKPGTPMPPEPATPGAKPASGSSSPAPSKTRGAKPSPAVPMPQKDAAVPSRGAKPKSAPATPKQAAVTVSAPKASPALQSAKTAPAATKQASAKPSPATPATQPPKKS